MDSSECTSTNRSRLCVGVQRSEVGEFHVGPQVFGVFQEAMLSIIWCCGLPGFVDIN